MTVIILAAGKGRRMGGNIPKVMQPLLGRPMISHIIGTVQRFSPEQILIVVSPDGCSSVKQELGEEGISYVIQTEPRGTADAVKCCADFVNTRRTLILCGDVPLIRARTIQDMIATHQSRGAGATLLSTELPDPSGYGRIIRNGDSSVRRIVEHKDATHAEKAVREINSGTYIFESELLFELLDEVEPSHSTGEYYLTDIIGFMVNRNIRVEAVKIEDRTEIMGVNDLIALKRVEDVYRQRLLRKWRLSGASIAHPQMLWADGDVELASGSQITGRAVLRGHTSVGPGSQVGPFVHLEDTVIEGNNCIKGQKSKSSS